MAISLDEINAELGSLTNRIGPSLKVAGDKLNDTGGRMRAALESTIKELEQEEGGMKGLTQEVDNAVENLEVTTAPIIGKMTEAMKEFVDAPEL
jgi:hypothetical protein